MAGDDASDGGAGGPADATSDDGTDGTGNTAAGPLSGLTVVDAASLYAGPLAATYLGDFGAEVLKVEHPDGGDPLRQFGGDGHSWEWVGRNKQSVPLDLKTEAGRDAFLEVVADADVLVESFRPGTLESWDLGWETLSTANPSLVMVRTTGFGQDGPYSDRPGFGTLIEAMSGFSYSTGEADGPPTLPPIALADSVCALHSAFATVAALYWRDVSGGTGQYIDTSILEAMFALMGDVVTRYHAEGDRYRRNGNSSRMTAPRNTYETADGRWVALSGSTDAVARRILAIVDEDLPEQDLLADERFETMEARIANADALDAIIAAWMAEHSREEILDRFEVGEAPLAPVYNMADIFEDEHFEARDAIRFLPDESGESSESADSSDSDAVAMRGVVPKLSETPGDIDHAGPELGAHAREVLAERAGLSEDDIDRLLEEGVTAVAEGTDGE